MKKLIVGLLAAFLMTSGLVAFTGSPASARPADCPYQGCIDTRTNADADPNSRTNSVGVTVNVRAVGSNLTPRGRVTLSIVKIKPNGNFRIVRTVFSDLRAGKTSFNIRNLRNGRYRAVVEYENNEKFGFNYSADSDRFRIR